MRESRTFGSVEGVASGGHPYSYFRLTAHRGDDLIFVQNWIEELKRLVPVL